jgi:hypothetical protein
MTGIASKLKTAGCASARQRERERKRDMLLAGARLCAARRAYNRAHALADARSLALLARSPDRYATHFAGKWRVPNTDAP